MQTLYSNLFAVPGQDIKMSIHVSVSCRLLCCAVACHAALQDAAGHHSSALFVQWVPYELAGTTWEDEEEKYVQHLINIVDDFAPGTRPQQAASSQSAAVPSQVRKH